jgi:hypothetical protein
VCPSKTVSSEGAVGKAGDTWEQTVPNTRQDRDARHRKR